MEDGLVGIQREEIFCNINRQTLQKKTAHGH